MAHRMSRLKKTIVVVSIAALSLGGAGVAFAYWTSTGSGTGEATTGDPATFVVAGQASEDPPLTPGGPSQTVPFTVTNPGPGTLFFGSATVIIADENGAPWEPFGECLAADYTATITTQPASGQLAAEDAVGGVVTVTMANTLVSQDDCQGQTVPLYFTASSVIPPG